MPDNEYTINQHAVNQLLIPDDVLGSQTYKSKDESSMSSLSSSIEPENAPVLIIDDSNFNIEAVKSILKQMKIDSNSAFNGFEGLK